MPISFGRDPRFSSLTRNLVDTLPTLTASKVLVGGVMCVDVAYTGLTYNYLGQIYSLPAGTVRLNTADVTDPTNFYITLSGTLPTLSASSVNPEVTPGRNNFVWVGLVRLKSVAGTATIYYMRRMYTANLNLMGEFGDYASDVPYTWVSGAGPTINATTGVVDIEACNYRRMKFASSFPAITASKILLEDEVTVVNNLEQITTYSDGSPIGGGKYHKVLLLMICSAAADNRLVAIRQGKPDTEYATLEDARIDAERKSASAAPSAYYAPTFALAYVWLKVGDASDLATQDLRQTGIIGGGGGGGNQIFDHSAAVNLGADDHGQYFRTDGARVMTGDINAGGNDVTNVGMVDGVDLPAHVADADAHHDRFSLDANAAALFSLTTQQLNVDTQAANCVLAGPASGIAQVPTFRALTPEDMAAGALLPFMNVSSPITQAITNVANAQVLTFADTDLLSSSGLTRTSTSRTTVTKEGTYEIVFSGIVSLAATPPNKHIEVWLRVDGVDVPRSNTRVEITNVNTEMTVAVALQYKFNAGQYFEIWTWGDDTDCRWLATAAAVGPVRPATPSVIMTVKMISGTGLA